MPVDDLADFWQHTVTVERYAGPGADADVYADGVALLGFVDDDNKLVRNAAGEQVVSSARVMLPASTALVPLGSRVTLGGPFLDRKSTVIAMAVHDGHDLPSHVELALL